jgi:hypothetical protein
MTIGYTPHTWRQEREGQETGKDGQVRDRIERAMRGWVIDRYQCLSFSALWHGC